MRKAWSTIFLLCMACMICMSGLCLAKDGNWIKYHNHDSSKYYVNPSSLKAREYEGRKYLEANVDISGTQMLLALDIENGKYIVLEGHNHVTGKTTKTDISQMSQQSPTFSGIPIYDKLIHWVEKNRPDVINEIRTHNRTAPPLPSAPRGKTDVSGPRSNTPIDPAPGVDRQPGTEGQPGGNVDVTGATGDMTPSPGFSIAEDGALQYRVRSIMSDGLWFLDDTTRFIFSRPAAFNKVSGGFSPEYIVASIVPERWFNGLDEGKWWIHFEFDYDTKTNTFTFYREIETNYADFDNNNKVSPPISYRIRVIDRNNVYCENMYGDKGLLSYKKALSLAWRQEHSDEQLLSGYSDNDGNVWYGKWAMGSGGRTYYHDELINCEVDAALAFLAAHGKTIEAPDDFWENSNLGDILPL